MEKENVEEADYANLSTKFLKHTDIQNGDSVPKYWNYSRRHLQYKPLCFLFSVSARTIRNYHVTVTDFHRGRNDFKKL